MPASFYTAGPNGLWIFLLLTVILGGATAFVSGKSIAETWRPFWQVPIYMAVLALVVRFLHFALFEEILLSAGNLLVDFVFLTVMAVIGYRTARSRQMATQYAELRRG